MVYYSSNSSGYSSSVSASYTSGSGMYSSSKVGGKCCQSFQKGRRCGGCPGF